jgi:hypothetical protein
MLRGARFDASGGGDPDDGNEGDKAEGHVWMLEGERYRDEVDEEREVVFAFDRFVLVFKFSGMAQTAGDGEAQEEKAEAGKDHRGDIDGDREGVHLLFQDIGGEEGQEGEAEEEAKVGVEDEVVGLLGAMDEMVMVDPVDRGEGERDEIEAQCGENGAQTGEAVLVGDLELEHHDGDDDGDDSIGEGLEAAGA